jgi:hypothetical protein
MQKPHYLDKNREKVSPPSSPPGSPHRRPFFYVGTVKPLLPLARGKRTPARFSICSSEETKLDVDFQT